MSDLVDCPRIRAYEPDDAEALCEAARKSLADLEARQTVREGSAA